MSVSVADVRVETLTHALNMVLRRRDRCLRAMPPGPARRAVETELAVLADEMRLEMALLRQPPPKNAFDRRLREIKP